MPCAPQASSCWEAVEPVEALGYGDVSQIAAVGPGERICLDVTSLAIPYDARWRWCMELAGKEYLAVEG